MEPTYPLIPILCFIGAVASAIPIPAIPPKQHLPAFMSMVWASQAAFRCFLNTVIWHGSVLNKAPVWCDISSRLDVGQNFGLPITATWMMYTVYRALSYDKALGGEREMRRQFWLGLFITIGIPIIQMGLQIIVSAFRYIIFEDFGCAAANALTWQFVVIVAAWPVIFALITIVYCILTIQICRRLQSARSRMFSSQSSEDQSIFFRTLLCAFINVCFQLPYTAFNLYTGLRYGLYPYVNWDYVHYDYNVIPMVPRVLWDRSTTISTYIAWTESIVPAFCCFIVFGTSNVTIRYYKRLFARIADFCGIRRKEEGELSFTAAARKSTTFHISFRTSPGTNESQGTGSQSSSASSPVSEIAEDPEAQKKAVVEEIEVAKEQ